MKKTLSLLLVLAMMFGVLVVSVASAAGIKTADVTVEKVDGTWSSVNKKTHKKVNYTGVASNKNGWWRIENGKVNFDAKGIYQNDYGWWYCKKGKVQFGYYGIQNNQYGWYRIEDGKVNFKASGVFKNEYGWYYCRKGKVDFSYNGLAKNQYGTWWIKKGKVDFDETRRLGYNQESDDVVKKIDADYYVERHTFSYSYDLSKKAINVEDLLTFAGGGFGGVGPYNEFAGVEDGLLTKETVIQYPELLTQVCEGGYNDILLFACNPYIRHGKVTALNVYGKGEVDAEAYKGTAEAYTVKNNYHERYTFEAKSGRLLKAVYQYYQFDPDYPTNYKHEYKFSYNPAGLLVKVTSDYDSIEITRDDYGFPTSVYYTYGGDFDESYSIIYDSARKVTKVNARSESASAKAFRYNDVGLPSSASFTNVEHPFTLQFSYASDLLTRLERESPQLEDCSTVYTWTELEG